VVLFSLQCLSQTFLILRWILWNIVTNVNILLCKLPIIFIRLKKRTQFFSKDFTENLEYNIWRRSIQGKPSFSMRTEGRTDRHIDTEVTVTKLIVAFWNLETNFVATSLTLLNLISIYCKKNKYILDKTLNNVLSTATI